MNSLRDRFLKPELKSRPAFVPEDAEDKTGNHTGWVMPCPACRAIGQDNTGNHLFVYPDSGVVCIIAKMCMPEDEGRDHNDEARRLLKLKPTTSATVERESIRKAKELLKILNETQWAATKATMSGEISDLGPSASIPDERGQFGLFCGLFRPGDMAWAGTLHDKPEEKWDALQKKLAEALTDQDSEAKRRFRARLKCYQHYRFRDHLFDPFSPKDCDRMFSLIQKDRLDLGWGLAWNPEATGRGDDQWHSIRFRVVEHDGPKDAPTPRNEQIAAIRYAREVCGWHLRYVLDTAGKGYHGIYSVDHLTQEEVDLHIRQLAGMGCDPAGLTRAHSRCPGAIRRTSESGYGGGLQHIVWLA